jgi:anti-sigma-K factor RskA
MTDTIEQIRELAGEYVLGTLPLAQRQDVERRLASEPLLRAEVAAWEQRLLPLTALAAPVEPSPAVWPKISHSLAGKLADKLAPQAVTTAGGWQRWWDDLRLWRALSGGAVFATLVLAVLLTRQPAPDALQPAYMVVLVAPQERTAGYVVQASLNRQLTLTPLQGTAVPGNKSLQFWTKGTTWKAPVSLGLVQPNQSLKLALDKLPQVESDQLFEITLEPQAGSPTGRPTGPILYIGRAVKVAM